MRILFLTQLFDPEPALKGVAFVHGLENAGHTVTVVTSFPNYPGGKLYKGYHMRPWTRDLVDGVDVLRLAHWPSHSQSGLLRALHFLSFFLSALLYLLINARKYDVVYVGHPGITTGLASLIAGRIWRLPYILDVQDLWPDSLDASGLGGASHMAKVIRPICDAVHNGAKHIIAQSEGIAGLLLERGSDPNKTTVIHNFAASAPEKAVPFQKQKSGSVVFLYAGNMGPLQGLDTLIEAAEIAYSEDKRIMLWLVGEGVEKEKLKAVIEQEKISNVQILPRVSALQLLPMISDADVLVLHLVKLSLMEITIPSKSQFYLAAGKPILAATSGEVAEIMRKSEAALVVPPQNSSAIAEAMLHFANMPEREMHQRAINARSYYEKNFSFDVVMKKTLNIIDSLN